MKKLVSLFLCLTFLGLLALPALALDPSPAHAASVTLTLPAGVDADSVPVVVPADVPLLGSSLEMLPPAWQKAVLVWAPLLVLILKILLMVSEYLSLTDRFKSNGNLQALANGLRSVLRYLPGGAVLVLLLLGGCVTINNSALSGEKNAVKTDTDAQQNISPNTSATIPLR